MFDVYGEGSDLGSLVTLYIHLFPSGSQINVASLFSIITLFSGLEGAPAPVWLARLPSNDSSDMVADVQRRYIEQLNRKMMCVEVQQLAMLVGKKIQV